MWAGMTNNDYEVADGGRCHMLTGMHWRSPKPVQWTAPSNPYILSSEGTAGFSVGLYIERDWGRALPARSGPPFPMAEDKRQFRRKFGDLHRLDRATPISGVVPWSAQLLEIVAMFHFISNDSMGFFNGERAFPDELEIVATEIPPEFRRTVTNPFARPERWLWRASRYLRERRIICS